MQTKLLDWTKIRCFICGTIDYENNMWETWYICQGFFPGQFICSECLDNPEVQCNDGCKICN